jgi:exosome complex component RRP4
METQKLELYVQNMDIVVPGDLIGEGELEEYSPYIHVEGRKLFSTVLGIVEIKEGKPRIIPLHTTYIPQVNDLVIGIIVDVGHSYWTVDINSPYEAQLNVSETPLKQVIGTENLRKFLDIGDYVLAKIISFERNKDPLITLKGKDLGKLAEGKVIEFRSSRVVWSILRRKKVIDALEEELGVSVLITSNGRAWIKGVSQEAEDTAILVLKKIDYSPFTKLTPSDILKLISEVKMKGGMK